MIMQWLDALRTMFSPAPGRTVGAKKEQPVHNVRVDKEENCGLPEGQQLPSTPYIVGSATVVLNSCPLYLLPHVLVVSLLWHN